MDEVTTICGTCGKTVDKDCDFCPWCGARFKDHVEVRETMTRPAEAKKEDEPGAGEILLAILGFLIPFIGIIGVIAFLASGKPKGATTISIATVLGFLFWLLIL